MASKNKEKQLYTKAEILSCADFSSKQVWFLDTLLEDQSYSLEQVLDLVKAEMERVVK